MFINSFGSLNAANMDFSIDVFLRQSWHDPRLVLPGPRERVAITNPQMLARLWKPDTYFSNMKDGDIHRVSMPNVLYRIYKTGDVLYSMRLTLRLSCHMEFREYPLDSQVCGVHVTSYANTDDLVRYRWLADRPIDLPEALEIAQFDLLGFSANETSHVYVTGNFSGLLAEFKLRRQSGYHVLQTYVPTVLIVIVSWVSFWLDPNAVPGRVTLGVTTLLTLTTLASGIRASLPPVSYVKAIDVWIGTCMILVFSALMEFTVVNWLFNKKVTHHGQSSFKIRKSGVSNSAPPWNPTKRLTASMKMWRDAGAGYVASTALIVMISARLAHGSAQSQMLAELLQDYDVNEWPHAEYKHPTTVRVQMFINSFGSLNAANMDYTIDVFLRQRWMDPRLRLRSGQKHITVSNPEMRGRIWKPDTFFNNVKDAEVHQVSMPNILLRIGNTGDVLYSMRITLKLSCILQLENFPFDAQQCNTLLASYANTDDVIKYRWEENVPIDLPDNLEIAQYDLLGHSTHERKQEFVTGNFSGLLIKFSLRRQNGYHVLQTYVPTILIVSISWVSFWLDPNAVPGRVSLGVTTLLTLTTLASGIRASLPPVSYVKAIDVWIGTCMIMVFGALLEFTLVNWLANKKVIEHSQTMFKIPRLTKAQEEEPSAAASPKTYITYARALDRLCRVLFPGGFLIFNLVYWPYYLVHQYMALPQSLV
ncbi:glutamate-gated chloride channel alpha isoform X2 [Penaeus vannamei]